MTTETSNARGETYTFDMIEDAWGDAVPLTKPYFDRFRARLETLRQQSAAPPPAALSQPEPKPVLSEPDRIGLYQGPDDCPQLMVNDRPVAIFPAGSWAKVCDALDSITGSVQPDPKAEARGVVDLTKVRNNVLAVIPGGSICDPQQVADDVRAVFAIFEAEARNGR